MERKDISKENQKLRIHNRKIIEAGFNNAKEKTIAYFKDAWDRTSLLKIKKRKYKFYPFRVLIGGIGVLAAICIINFILSIGIREKPVKMELENGTSYETAYAGDKSVIYNNKGAVIADKDGNVKTINRALSQPIADIDGSYMILADLSGNHFAGVYKNDKQVSELNITTDIISAKVTKDGFSAIAADADGYRGRITVFNNRGNEIYTWSSGSGYITDMDITDNGRYLAAAQLITDEETVKAKIQFIDTRRGEVIAASEREGEAIAEVKYISDDKLVVVTDCHILAYNKSGKQLFDISLEGKTPSLYSLDSDECIGVVTLDNRGNHVLEMYNLNGKKLGAYTAESEIRALSTEGKTAVVAEQKGVVRVNAKGKVKKVVPMEHDVQDICCFNGGRVLVVGASSSETINVK